MRGTRRGGDRAGRVRRIIPACAGDAVGFAMRCGVSADHPRVCGGRETALFVACAIGGSSPRVRGTPTTANQRSVGQRIIPACAGDAVGFAMRCGVSADHPRVCGGRETALFVACAIGGSSPRVRGTPTTANQRSVGQRIIPACAGDACRAARPHPPAPDHPRVCGGRFSASSANTSGTGSSPRVRGTLVDTRLRQVAARIIPACAGDAHRCATMSRRSADHPRVCGGRLDAGAKDDGLTGSSPRVRGTPAPARAAHGVDRIIPACAGDATRPTSSAAARPDHPRVCGGRARPADADGAEAGSSPRVRGTHTNTQPQGGDTRIIPACAGDAKLI